MKKYFNISKLFLIIGALLISLNIYYPKSDKEILLPDIIDINETMNYSFEVNWNDEDSNRPSSVTYNLYNVLDENTVISTVTLTDSNIDSNDVNKWKGTFNNVRKYNDDESFATYIIKQQEIPNYVQHYNLDKVDTLCIKFGNNVFNGDTTKSIKFIGTIKYIRYSTGWHYDTWDHYYVNNNRTNGTEFYYEDLANKTICVYSMMGEKAIYIEGKEKNLDIEDIYYADRKYDYDEFEPVYDLNDWTTYHIDEYDQYVDKDYPNNPKSEMNRYVLDNHYGNFPGANIITNNYKKINFKFDAYWEDEGKENNRPSSAEYYLYRKDNQNDIVKTVTLTNANADSNDSYHWIGYFNDVDGYNEDGSPIEYVVRQKDLANYINSYDSNEGYSITFNDESIVGHYDALSIHFYDPINNKWRYFKVEEYYDGIGEMMFGKTFNIKFDRNYSFAPDEYYEYSGGVPYQRENPSLILYNTHQTEYFVGSNYPESHHPLTIYECFDYEYRYSLSNHTPRMALFYNGASWSGQYGLKFDSIKTLGNENIVTSRYNAKDLEISKKWEDNGHESERPTSTTIDIYDAKHPNKIVKTVEIKNTDKVDNYTWKKKITGLPAYDKDLQEIEYLIVERTTNGYKAIYDFDDYYNALAVTFGDNISLYDTYMLYPSTDPHEGEVYRKAMFAGSSLGYSSDHYWDGWDSVTNRTVYVPLREFIFLFESRATNYRFNITDITLVHIDGFDEYFYGDNILSKWSYIDHASLGAHLLSDTTYENYPLLDFDVIGNKMLYFRYKWNGSTVPKKNANIIINKYDKTTYDFQKVWDDVGKEDGRPESVKYSIYNEKDLNTVVKTMNLTSANENPNNHYEWNGIFKNIPKYNNDGSIAKYVVKEEKLDKYKAEHEKEFDSICVKFGNDVFGGDDTRKLNFYVRNKDDLTYIYKLRNENAQPGNDPANFYLSDLKNNEVCLPLVDGYNDFYLVSDFEREEITYYIYGNPYYEMVKHSDLRDIDIVDIYRKNTNNTYHYELGDDGTLKGYLYNLKMLDFNNNTELPKATEEDQHIHYTWIGDNFSGRTIIINHANMRDEGYIKEFNDTGYEYNRPKNVVFGLFTEDDALPKSITILNTDDCINNKCEINFENIQDKDSNGNPISYTIREMSDYGYDVTYDGDKVINTANPKKVKIVKEDDSGKAIKGAKLTIYNKDGDELKTITTNGKTIELSLLPSEYTIKETETPKGYERCEEINITVNSDGTIKQNGNIVDVVKVVNVPIKEYYNITLKKTMDTKDKKEFTFNITITDFNGTLNYTGDKKGTIEFINGKGSIKLSANQSITINNIEANSKYEIVEQNSDYILTIKGENKGTLNKNINVEFINKPKVIPAVEPIVPDEPEIPTDEESPTPLTGVIKYGDYIIAGLLIISAIVLLIFRQRLIKKEIN